MYPAEDVGVCMLHMVYYHHGLVVGRSTRGKEVINIGFVS